MRLFKHRLQVCSSAADSTFKPLLSISVFLAHEMIRFAEVKAIFAFRVRQASHRKSLVLKIISWDNMVATSDKSTTTTSLSSVHDLHWSRMVQIVYEERVDVEDAGDANALWVWNTDWCCEPLEDEDQEKAKSGNAPVSAVSLVLETDEWCELHDELTQGSHFFAAEMAAATVMAKTGSDRGRLTAILLP